MLESRQWRGSACLVRRGPRPGSAHWPLDRRTPLENDRTRHRRSSDRKRSLRFRWLVTGVAVLAAVGAGSGCATNRAEASRPNERGDITAFELEAGTFSSVYDAVSRLRPEWMRSLGGAFLMDTRLEMGELYRVPVAGISRIELISAEEATRRWGTRELSSRFLHIITR